MKVKIHPLFLAVCVCLVGFGKGLLALWGVVAVLLHEYAHIVVARFRGYSVGSVTLMPYGGAVDAARTFGRRDGLWIAMAGPFVNAVLALLCLSVWWIAPSAYHYTIDFFNANVVIAVFNLLPCFPLDGGRFLLCLCGNKLKVLRALRAVGVVLAFIMFGLGIASFWFTPNITIAVGGIFLFYGAVLTTKKEEERTVTQNKLYYKEAGVALCIRTYFLPDDLPLYKAIRYINSNSICHFEIEGEGGVKKLLSEKELLELCEKFPLSNSVISTLVKN